MLSYNTELRPSAALDGREPWRTQLTEIDTKALRIISPYGGELVDLLEPEGTREELREHAKGLPSIQLSQRSVCDLEMLACGAFSPIDRFMNAADYQTVMAEMRLQSGHIAPIPITLPANSDDDLALGRDIALRDARNELLATMTVEEIYPWDRDETAAQILGTRDVRHPLVAEMYRWGELNISGRLQVLQLPKHLDFKDLRLTPAETRVRVREFSRTDVVAFQTRNPLHRVHEEMTKRAVREIDGMLLLHPAVGMTRPGDVDHYTRVRTYKTMAKRYFDPDEVLLSLLPLAMWLAGPREAVWHALIRRNYGANHLIMGRDHASPGLNSAGEPFYAPYAAQKLAEEFSEELKVRIIPFQEFVYLPDEDRYEERSAVPARAQAVSLSGTQMRDDYLNSGKSLPEWYTRPEIAEILQDIFPPRHKQGVCIWFTGLSSAGKSTTAESLTSRLLELGRQVTLLDGDVVRTHLSKGLGFDKQDRDTNIRRIGFVAAEIVRHSGVVVCAAVSPYRATRNDVRNMVGSDHFIEVFVDTPLDVCESRDAKGMYAKARRGEIVGFTGIDDPYEPPESPEIRLETVGQTPEENADRIVGYLEGQGLIREPEA